MFVCFAFIGPCPYMSFIPATFASVCGSLVAQGFRSSAISISSFSSAQRAAVESGLPDSMEVQAVVSGVYTSAFALGNFFGPTVSGVLYDKIGFVNNLLVLQALVVISFVLNLIIYKTRATEAETNLEEKTGMLQWSHIVVNGMTEVVISSNSPIKKCSIHSHTS